MRKPPGSGTRRTHMTRAARCIGGLAGCALLAAGGSPAAAQPAISPAPVQEVGQPAPPAPPGAGPTAFRRFRFAARPPRRHPHGRLRRPRRHEPRPGAGLHGPHRPHPHRRRGGARLPAVRQGDAAPVPDPRRPRGADRREHHQPLPADARARPRAAADRAGAAVRRGTRGFPIRVHAHLVPQRRRGDAPARPCSAISRRAPGPAGAWPSAWSREAKRR